MTDLSADTWDVVIAGGGSAGCVLAARLSEDPATRVLLVEAGPDLRQGAVPAALASAFPGRAYFGAGWLWPDLRVNLGADGSNRPAAPRAYEQARILGGGSSINGLGANRGAPGDYDEWVERGAAGWGWADVLPFFRKLERDRDFPDAPLHGKDGPLPIQRVRRADWSGFVRAVADAAGALGHEAVDDQNGEWADGVIPTAVNLDAAGRRAGAALAYLTEAVRRRPNLAILTGTAVERILVADGRATGLALTRASAGLTVAARHVIVSAGALGSPLLLLRSGIGPQDQLRAHGIAVQFDRAGVGENLQEHPAIGVSAFLAPAARVAPGERYHLQALLRWSSGLDGAPPGDMHVAISSRSAWHAVGRRIGSLYGWVNKSYATGRIRLGPHPDGPPDVDFRMLSDARDLRRLMASFRLCVRLLGAVAARGSALSIFPSGYSPRIKQLLRPGARNQAVMAVVAPLMDLDPALRRRLLALATDGAPPVERLAADDALLEAHLRRHVGGVWHPCGTCRMGHPADPLAVTDPAGRVIGIAGLTVCDASLMPTIPRANLNIPVLMMAEKIADGIRRGG